ncbi:MAG: hypothetical protein GXZ08_07635 [Tissierellia bacterium]|nr:hypothetical protein [Tissierellia bacterium]
MSYMKNQSKGFINILIIIVLSILSCISMYISEITIHNSMVLSNTENRIQAQYIGEANILNCYTNIKETEDLSTILYNLIINDSKYDFKNERLVLDSSLNYESKVLEQIVWSGNVPILKLIDEITYNGTKISVEGNINLYNKLLFTNNDHISAERYSRKEELQFNSLITGVYEFIDSREIQEKLKFVISENGTIFHENGKNYMSNEESIIELPIETRLLSNDKLHIGLDEINSNIELSGVLICNGDIELKCDLNFTGIVIMVNSKLINNGYNFDVKGCVISDKNSESFGLEVKYDAEIILDSMKELPFFLDLKLNSVKLNTTGGNQQ